jgi:hypothetical protein
MDVERPAGVTAIAIAFFLAAAYLLVLGLIMLLDHGAISMILGSPLLGGLELAGPYMFLLMAAIGGLIGAGLLQLRNWARWMAIVAALAGIVGLMPDVSGAVVGFRAGKLAWSALGVIVRVMMLWYLYQAPVVDRFTRPSATPS